MACFAGVCAAIGQGVACLRDVFGGGGGGSNTATCNCKNVGNGIVACATCAWCSTTSTVVTTSGNSTDNLHTFTQQPAATAMSAASKADAVAHNVINNCGATSQEVLSIGHTTTV